MLVRESIARTPATAPAVPPLEQGDHLSRAEFERRYAAHSTSQKFELIEGVVHMAPAVRYRYHSGPHADLVGWMASYRAMTPGIHVSLEGTIRLDLDNEPQPDAAMFIDPAHGGQVAVDSDDYLRGAPELVAEISSSTVSFDLNTKLHVYRRNGVREYIVWRVFDQQIDWFILRKDEYQNLTPTDGIHRSETFPGLWLDAAAMTRGDLAGALKLLQSGIASPEHETFAAQFR